MSDQSTPAHERRANPAHFQPSPPVMLVLVVLLVVGAYVMLRAHSPASASSNTLPTSPNGSTTTTAPTTPRAVVKSQVRVQVANGTTVTGLAGTYTHQLLTAGWDVLPAANALGPRPAATEIFYNPGFKEAAKMIATSIQISPSAIVATGGQTPVAGSHSDDVIIVLGPDAATK